MHLALSLVETFLQLKILHSGFLAVVSVKSRETWLARSKWPCLQHHRNSLNWDLFKSSCP